MADYLSAGVGPAQLGYDPMTFKNALLAGSLGALLMAAPALAQEAAAPAQDPAAAAPAQQSLQLTPGAAVRGPDGALGTLEGVQANAEGGQELTVRGADGQLRAVPLAGIRQEGSDVVVAYTKTEYDAAAPIAGASPAPAATPAPAPSSDPVADPTTADPSSTMTDPADPATTADPMAPPTGSTEPQA